MQALLVFLAVSAVIGVRGHRQDKPAPFWTVLALSMLLALTLYSRRIGG